VYGGVVALLLALIGGGSYVLFRPREWIPPRDENAWPEDYPSSLRERAWGQPIDLLRLAPYGERLSDPARGRTNYVKGPPANLTYQPVWSRLLVGDGRYHDWEDWLSLESPFDPSPSTTLLALDDDRARRWFELTAEVRQPFPSREDRVNWMGVFFGWQEIEGRQGRAYFVCLDTLPPPEGGPPYRQLSVGQGTLTVEAPGAKVIPLTPVQGDVVPHVRLTNTGKGSWHQLRVRAVANQVTVAVDDETPIEFVPPFDPRGSLGIWVQDGEGWFRTISVSVLPD
jgi:hypothetical protein